MIRYFSKTKNRRTFSSNEKTITILFHYEYEGENLSIGVRYETMRFGYKEDTIKWHNFKCSRKDIEIAKQKIKLLRKKFVFEHEWVDFRDELLKAIRMNHPKNWDEVLPEKITLWASQELKRMAKGEPCSDNFRVARVGNTCQERRYRRQMKQGCCGFCDVTKICPHDGNVYKLGFNYGH